MREITFRAWDIDNKQFIYAHIGQDDVWLDDGISTIEIPLHHSDFEQYTGLKDKNGKEIYEGDIIEALIDGMWSTGRNTVSFGKAKWKLEAYWEEKRFAFMWHILGSKTCPDRVYDFYDSDITEIEVIGNIHENPELLSQKGA